MNRTTAIIITIATAVLCGCPGLSVCIGGAWSGLSPVMLGTVGGSSEAMMTAILTAVASVCGGIILIAIPVAVGFFTLRNAPPA
jgi:hypothetical protein